MEKNTYVCCECGCVFEEKNIIVNLKERLGKESFKSFLKNPFKRVSGMMKYCVCPECGSEKVVGVDEKTEAELPEYMTTGWDSTLLEEYFDVDAQSADNLDEKSGKSGIRDFVGKAIGFFNGKIDDFKEKYHPSELMSKISAVAKKAGASTIYHALLLYYALTGDDVPTNKKIIVMAALGYFIAPVDFIPDFVLMGLLDDGSVLLFALNQILPYITDKYKAKALDKLHEWFGETDIVSIKSNLLPDINRGEAEVMKDTVEVQKPEELNGTEVIIDGEIHENGNLTSSDIDEKINYQASKNMKIIAPYKEINDYVAARFNQPISLAFGSEKEVKVSYTKRVLFKDRSVNIRIGIEEVKADSVLLSYDVAYGLDSIISGALSFIKGQFPELSAGIHPEDGHRIRINLAEIEKAKAVAENIELLAISPCEDCLRIEFRLKVS